MFEFHGWVVIRYHTHDTDLKLQNNCWKNLEKYINEVNKPRIYLQRHNGCDSLFVVGQHNHRAGGEYVFEVFRWIATHAPGSYGILYIRDDEDMKRGADFSNEFRVWRLYRGVFIEERDPFLSPAIPTVEDVYDPTRGD
jgi:Immunity protein 7